MSSVVAPHALRYRPDISKRFGLSFRRGAAERRGDNQALRQSFQLSGNWSGLHSLKDKLGKGLEAARDASRAYKTRPEEPGAR